MKIYAGIVLLLTLVTGAAFAQPIVIGSDSVVCAGNYRIQLSASPAGGFWTGDSITPSGSFRPDTNFIPRRFVRVCYNFGTQIECRTFTIKRYPRVNIITADQTVCANGDPIQLAFSPALPIGTINGPANSSGLFTPTPALVGTNVIRYVVDTNGCASEDDIRIVVKPAPTARINTVDQELCSNDAPLQLATTPAPNQGTFGGAVSAGGVFTPSPGVVGLNIITFTVDLNQCKASDTMRIVVRLAPTVDVTTVDQELCANDPPLQISANSAPPVGSFSGSVSPSGLFTPSVALVGVNTITYTVDTNGCAARDQVRITVKNIPVVSAGPQLQLCSNDPPTRLTGQSPAGGNFSPLAPWLTGFVFTPDTNAVGVNTVRYSYTDPATGCSNSDTRFVIVNRAPRVYAGRDTFVCANAKPFNLQGYFPVGGTWSAPASANGRFTPSNALTGFNPLTYTWNNTVTGCSAKDTVIVQVVPIPTSVNAGTNQAVCSNSPAFNLTGASPAGGYWEGNGVDSATGRFTPSNLITGTQLIRYIIVGDSGCRATDSLFVNVRPLPRANAGVDFNACSGNAAVQIGDFPLDTTRGLRYHYLWTGSDGTLGFNSDTISNPTVDFVNSNPDSLIRSYYLRVTRVETGQPTCFNFDTIQVVIYSKPVARTIPPLNFRGCEGDSITLRAETKPRMLYQWLNNTTLLTPAPSDSDSVYVATYTGRYRLILVRNVQVRGGVCADTSTGDSIFIKKRVLPNILGFPNYCRNRTDTLRVDTTDRQFAYQWLRQTQLTDTTRSPYQIIIGALDTIYNANQVGLYSVVIADNRFGVICYDTSEAVRVDSIRTPYADLVGLGNDSTFTVCTGQLPLRLEAPLVAPGTFEYLWHDSSTTRFNLIDTTGKYWVRVYNRCGAATDTLIVKQILPTPEFSILQTASKDTIVCRGIPYSIAPPSLDTQYLWFRGGENGERIPLFNGQPRDRYVFNTDSLVTRYLLYAQARSPLQGDACYYSDSAFISVVECEPVVYIPTAFSPQGDNINDKWILAAYSIKDIDIRVFNRWGEQVYAYKASISDSATVDQINAFNLALQDKAWDGNYKEKPCQSSAYQYVITYSGTTPGSPIDANGRRPRIRFKRTGTVTLLR